MIYEVTYHASKHSRPLDVRKFNNLGEAQVFARLMKNKGYVVKGRIVEGKIVRNIHPSWNYQLAD